MPEFIALHQALRAALAAAEFDQAWEQGQQLDLQVVVTGLRTAIS